MVKCFALSRVLRSYVDSIPFVRSRVLNRKIVWIFEDSRENVLDMYWDSRENLLHILAVVTILSKISSVCGYTQIVQESGIEVCVRLRNSPLRIDLHVEMSFARKSP